MITGSFFVSPKRIWTMKSRKLLLAAIVLATLHSTAHADLKEAAHHFKENVKEGGEKIGHGAREAGHATADASKKVAHAVANTARHGYRATKNAIRHAVHKRKSGDEATSQGEEAR
jgi:hypothetical protein